MNGFVRFEDIFPTALYSYIRQNGHRFNVHRRPKHFTLLVDDLDVAQNATDVSKLAFV